jgi:hypothetical protein
VTINRECFVQDPAELKLLNNGVAEVKDLGTEDDLRTLYFELKTFVCEGQYAKGLERILGSFLANIGSEQPASWVSGFFGSGKSHLVKMLRALWTDKPFSDGARPSGLAKLSPDVKASLIELANQAKKYGGVHAAAGTLSSQTSGTNVVSSVRLAVLAIIFRSCGLPERISLARFTLRLMSEGIFSQVKAHVESKGKEWNKELASLYVSPIIAEALVTCDPDFPVKSAKEVGSQLKTQFPDVVDVSNNEMMDIATEAICQFAGTKSGQLPLTLIALDEVQQFIGENGDRSMAVQEVVEALSKHTKGRLLVVATGQSAIAETKYLQRLQGRFPPSARIELTDQDVDTVVRNVLLLKNPTATEPIRQVLVTASGEIDRHLVGTAIAPNNTDRDFLVADYPLLPVRRRFWEQVLRRIDVTGTAGQLRNQLRVVLEALRLSADKPLGHVVPADVIFDQLAPTLLHAQVLARETNETIAKLRQEGPDGILKARICGLVFLIGKLDHVGSGDIGVRATADVIADLLVEDLGSSSGDLRKRVTDLLDQLVKANHVLLVATEYRIQTREGVQWEADYAKRRQELVSKPQRLIEERALIIQGQVTADLDRLNQVQGVSKEPRAVVLHWLDIPPKADLAAIPVWVQEGADRPFAEFMNQVNAEGQQSHVVFVHLPNPGDSLNDMVASFKAAQATIDVRGLPSTTDGKDAQLAMETRRRKAQESINKIIGDMQASARVFLGGGAVMSGNSLSEQIAEGVRSALIRRFPKFGIADQLGWDKVIVKAKAGNTDALAQLGYNGEPDKHPVCTEVIAAIGAGSKGKDLRSKFESSPYGWGPECLNGALMVLVAAGHVRASLNGAVTAASQLDQSKIGQAEFVLERAVVTIGQRMVIRKLAQDAGVPCKPNEEHIALPQFLQSLKALAASAGGQAPAPNAPSTTDLDALLGKSGNDQIIAAAAAKDALGKWAAEWKDLAAKISVAQTRWTTLNRLLGLAQASHLPGLAAAKTQMDAIIATRALLAKPDPVQPLIDQLTAELRHALSAANDRYKTAYESAWHNIETDPHWTTLADPVKHRIPRDAQLAGPLALAVGSEEEVMETAARVSVPHLVSQLDALPERVAKVKLAIAQENEPKAQHVKLPSATLREPKDLDAWLDKVRADIVPKLKNGPVVL